MTDADFDRAVALTQSRPDSLSVRGARLVLVQGYSGYRAARELGIQPSGVAVAVRRIARATALEACPQCGRAL